MLRHSLPIFFFAIPKYSKHTKSSYRAGEFLAPHTSRKFIDKTTMTQEQRDKRQKDVSPLARTLQAISNNKKIRYSGGMSGSDRASAQRQGKFKSAGAYLSTLNPHNRSRPELFAPWLYNWSKHERKQKGNMRGGRTSHVVEATGSDDHMFSSLDDLDRAAYEFCLKTESRWPLVQKLVLDSFEWWKEMDEIQTLLVDSSSTTNNNSSSSALVTTNNHNRLPPLNEKSIEKGLSSFSPTQIRAMKSRTYSLMLQGYACCLGNFRDFPIEAALLSGFGEHMVALSTNPDIVNQRTVVTSSNKNHDNDDIENKTKSGGGASRLSSLLIQVLFIGLIRHQSVADFKTLGLPQVGRLAQHPLGLEKLPNLVSQIMKVSLKQNDIDGAIRLGYGACVYCSSSNQNTNNTISSSFGVSSIPTNCTVMDQHRRIPQHILASHFPYSRPFITLSYCWGWNHKMCRDIQEISSAAWLFELSTIALVSMVDCPTPCGIQKRILKAIQLVSSSCERWLELLKIRKKSSSTSLLKDSEKWSSASILISLKRLGPVLEMLNAVEEAEENLERRKIESPKEEEEMKMIGDGAVASSKKENEKEEDSEDDEEEDEPNPKTKRTRNFFILNKRNPFHTQQEKSNQILPTSYSPSQIGVPQLINRNKRKNQNENDDNDDEYSAATFFAKTMRSAANECFRQIGPYFDIEVETHHQLLESGQECSETEENHQEEEEERFNVPRSVLAEVADACEYISTCPVFVGNNNEMSCESHSSQQFKNEERKRLKENYDKLNEKLQEVVLG